jgi:ArsR family transcriptional regulator, lead/cadmium/zinc/bismuth-responsive transcriptional repressor
LAPKGRIFPIPKSEHLRERSCILPAVATELVAVDSEAVDECQAALPGEEIVALIVQAFDALADANRVKILYALMHRPLCVRDLAITISASESAVSHQLRILRERRLVKTERKGHLIEYRVDDHHVAALFKEAEYHADHLLHGRPDHTYA